MPYTEVVTLTLYFLISFLIIPILPPWCQIIDWHDPYWQNCIGPSWLCEPRPPRETRGIPYLFLSWRTLGLSLPQPKLVLKVSHQTNWAWAAEATYPNNFKITVQISVDNVALLCLIWISHSFSVSFLYYIFYLYNNIDCVVHDWF